MVCFDSFSSCFTFGLAIDFTAVALPVGFMYLASAGRGGCGSSLTSSFFTRFAGVFFFGTAPDLMMTDGDQWIDCIADKSCVEQRL